MFDYLKGSLIEAHSNFAVIDVNGVGYKVFIPLNVYSQLLEPSDEVLLYTTFIVREDAQNLYGFLTKEQRSHFEMLLSVSGIGPKSALALIGNVLPDQLEEAILHADIRLISKAPGIGKKTAERLIIELKDKWHTAKEDSFFPTKNKSVVSDAISALMSLGYSSIKAQKAIQSILDEKEPQDLSTLVSKALRNI